MDCVYLLVVEGDFVLQGTINHIVCLVLIALCKHCVQQYIQDVIRKKNILVENHQPSSNSGQIKEALETKTFYIKKLSGQGFVKKFRVTQRPEGMNKLLIHRQKNSINILLRAMSTSSFPFDCKGQS